VIKVVIAYIDADQFPHIRKDLALMGITSMSAIAAGGASTDSFVAPHYRGTPHTDDLAEKIRMECVVGTSHVHAVKEAILRHEGRRTFLFVMNVEEATPEETVRLDAGEVVP
jgi:nitrogen regulatory protein PII